MDGGQRGLLAIMAVTAYVLLYTCVYIPNTDAYQAGYDDFPNSTIYDSVQNIRYEQDADSSIWYYCDGYEDAARDNRKLEIEASQTNARELVDSRINGVGE